MDEPFTDLYDDPDVYDILHAPGTAEAVTGLERIAKLHLSGAARRLPWLEPACGTGRHLLVAARRGRRGVGFDLKPAMVEYARARVARSRVGRRVELFVADMTRFADHLRPRSIGLAFNLINTIRHLDSDRAMLDHFKDVARVLHPGGLYAVGVSLSLYGHEPPTEDVWVGARGLARVKQVVQYEPPTARRGASARVERVYSHLTITRGRRTTYAHSTYALRCYSPEQWHELVERSALRVRAEVTERGEPLHVVAPGYAVYLLGRRAS